MADRRTSLLQALTTALGCPAEVGWAGEGTLPSCFAVSDLAQASIGAAGAALAELVRTATGAPAPEVVVDRPLASAWFFASVRPEGWSVPPPWDAVAGDYPTADGWIRLHTNAPHHRTAALRVLGVEADRAAVAAAVGEWKADDLEAAVVAASGAAAAMRSVPQWAEHPQGRTVAGEPLVSIIETAPGPGPVATLGHGTRPLAGVRILDLTRVLAGPVATRLLAGWGAEVLRIDAPDWDEPSLAPEVTVGKRCARLDLRADDGRERFLDLLASADVVVHGYRADALERLDLGPDTFEACRPGLVDVSLNAYGWSGPWRNRRGFDSLVQMSSGIARTGQDAAGADHPVSLPVQALDHATGYLLAASVIRGLTVRLITGAGSRWRTSLARMAALLVAAGPGDGEDAEPIAALRPPFDAPVEHTTWGPARRLAPPVRVAGAPLSWSLPARALGSDPPVWQ